MKKYLVLAILFFALAIPVVLLAETTLPSSTISGQTTTDTTVKLFPKPLKAGDATQDVKNLQNILKNDQTIYPEGLVTGYYGKLTEEAVKRLQEKYGLPKTGIVDESTQAVIFPPKVELKILAPNGGEVWDKSELHTIMWETKIGSVAYQGREILAKSSSAPNSTSGNAATSPDYSRPFFHTASLDLVPNPVSLSAQRVHHIATVDLYDSQYSWKISAEILNGTNYYVRISVGENVPCAYRMQGQTNEQDIAVLCPLRDATYSASDISDAPFSITGTTPPSSEIIAKLKAHVEQLQQSLEKLSRQIQELKALIENL